MLTSIRGVVIAYTKAWKKAQFSEYKSILIGFPSAGIKPIWCIVWGRQHWGKTKSPLTGNPIEIQIKKGLTLEVCGKYEVNTLFDPDTPNKFIVKAENENVGGFKILGEYRKERTVTLTADDISWLALKYFRFSKIEDKVNISGNVPYYKHTDFNKPIVIAGQPLVVDIDSNGVDKAIIFDKDSNVKICRYESESKG